MKLSLIAALFLSTISTAVLAKQQLMSVPVRFETLLSSEMFTTKHQDKFETPKAVVAQDILDIDGNISIKEGTEVVVTVDTKQRKNMARRGKITFVFKEVEDVNGNLVPLDATFDVVGRKKAGLVGQVFSGELTKKSQFSISGVGSTTVIGAVAVGTAASVGLSSTLIASVSKIGINKISSAIMNDYNGLVLSRFSDAFDLGANPSVEAVNNKLSTIDTTWTDILGHVKQHGTEGIYNTYPNLPENIEGLTSYGFHHEALKNNYTNFKSELIPQNSGFTKFALQHEIALQRTLKVAKVVAIGAVATAVAAGAITTIILASTKGKEAVIEPGTIWQVVMTAPSL